MIGHHRDLWIDLCESLHAARERPLLNDVTLAYVLILRGLPGQFARPVEGKAGVVSHP